MIWPEEGRVEEIFRLCSCCSLLSHTMHPPPKRLLVTGPPGIGKTTLITRVLEKLKIVHPELNVRGFYTREIRQAGERTGFEVVTVDGCKGALAYTNISGSASSRWPSVGRYKVDVPGFEALALPQLQVNEDCNLYVIDEVGKMELFSSSFFPAVWGVFNSNVSVLASIPVSKFGRDIPEVARIRDRNDVAVYTLNKQNRDDVSAEIFTQLNANLHC